MVRDFYLNVGLTIVNQTEQETTYKFDLENYEWENQNIIEVIWKDERQD